MLNDFMQSRIRLATEKWLVGRVTIRQAAQSTGEFGETIENYQVVHNQIPCRVITAGGRTSPADGITSDQESIEQIYRLIVRAGVTLAVDQTAEIDGVTYRIVALETALTNEMYRSAIIVRR